ncbi:MAG TPA: 4Fe-4S dicluster domain-containing protein [Anaeromyxobacteraceae bacterium]|nr:4Fe-4S dicluster domain-containing protein [Anaeromyxobacteraceae bacterium]
MAGVSAASKPGGSSVAAEGRTGLFFCRCGPNLGHVVALRELEESGAWPQAGCVATHEVLCSEEGKAWLAERIRGEGLERVVIAACSPKEHEATFRKVMAREGRSPFLLQMVNLREQVEWAGGAAELATERARRLVRGALARVALHRPLEESSVPAQGGVLVVGGGAAGISAALALARRGRSVILAEREFALGGLAAQLDEIFPDLACASCFMEPALDQVLHHEHVEVVTGAEVTRVRGAAGRFAVELAVRPRRVNAAACLGCGQCAAACPVEVAGPWPGSGDRRKAIHLPYVGCLPHASVVDEGACLRFQGRTCEACAAACAFGAVQLDQRPATRELEVGAIVIATGLRPGEVDGPEGVVSSYQLERMLHPNGPTGGRIVGPGGKVPRDVLLASAAGPGADAELGAREILKLAHLVKARLPGACVAVAGGLDRAPALAASAGRLAREGIELLAASVVPGDIAPDGDRVLVRLSEGSVEGVRAADLVVLHAPARPASGAAALGDLLRIARDGGGFLEDGASPFQPTATRVPGVFVAGAAAGPRPIAQAIRDGTAAAGMVLSLLAPGEPVPVEPLGAEVDLALCGGCGVCASVCPFGAVTVTIEAGRRRARVEPVHCRGCGTCAAACPTGAAGARHFTRAQISAEISALLRPAASRG